jgi:hypothetical protein
MRQRSLGLRRSVALTLCFSLAAASVAYATDVPLTPATAKQMLQARGPGKMVKVKEADGTTVRAKIVSIGDDSVVLQDGSKPAVTIAYSQLTAVKGPGLSTGAKVGIWVAVGVVATVAIVVAVIASKALGGLKNVQI